MENFIERELEIARGIQASFLPDVLPNFQGWEVSARFQPALHVAGDFYDAFPLVQNRRLGLVIGDVCDKGVGAALFMALTRTLIRAFAQQHYALRWMENLSDREWGETSTGERPMLPSIGNSALKNAIELTNNYIAVTHGEACMFSTLFFGILDPSNGHLQYINAGHEPPFILRSGGEKLRLMTTSPVIGIFPNAHFDIHAAQLEPGDILFAYTDGVTEAVDSTGALFGSQRLDALFQSPISSAAYLLDRVLLAVAQHSGALDPSDDITLLAARRELSQDC